MSSFFIYNLNLTEKSKLFFNFTQKHNPCPHLVHQKPFMSTVNVSKWKRRLTVDLCLCTAKGSQFFFLSNTFHMPSFHSENNTVLIFSFRSLAKHGSMINTYRNKILLECLGFKITGMYDFKDEKFISFIHSVLQLIG